MGNDELAATRRSLHGVAELVLAGPQYRATGRLRLGMVPGGFATTTLSPACWLTARWWRAPRG